MRPHTRWALVTGGRTCALPIYTASRLSDSARRVPDTDWHIAKLYAFARGMGASMIVPVHSRYVVDLNRAEDDVSLYPGHNTTGLCPVGQFTGEPVSLKGVGPGRWEVAARVERSQDGRRAWG